MAQQAAEVSGQGLRRFDQVDAVVLSPYAKGLAAGGDPRVLGVPARSSPSGEFSVTYSKGRPPPVVLVLVVRS